MTSGVKELRVVLEEARNEIATGGRRTLLFIDEIHRFNRAQQDVLLPDVEEGVVTLVGATTANPFFAVISALVSRSQIFQFHPLSKEDVRTLLECALTDRQRGWEGMPYWLHPDALDYLAEVCDGDARWALTALEVAVLSSDHRPLELTCVLAAESVQRKAIDDDPTGTSHYDVASALIKSIRGSDPDAGLYWLARMLEAGEDVRFLCRRLGDPGQRGCRQCGSPGVAPGGRRDAGLRVRRVTRMPADPGEKPSPDPACAPKSNASTVAIGEAIEDARHNLMVPAPGPTSRHSLPPHRTTWGTGRPISGCTSVEGGGVPARQSGGC